jgi:succinoglycan biosynthesis protein ExoM
MTPPKTSHSTHITVCICTYKRPTLLRCLLHSLQNQITEGFFTHSIVIVDNDREQSARDIVQFFGEHSGIPVAYYCEPEQNIALARNKAVGNATGDFLAFIDDDEYPPRTWLIDLYKACEHFDADGILGPVISYFETDPPDWIVKGKFYERPVHRTGMLLDWTNTRTGNVLLRRRILNSDQAIFKPEFGRGGEDKDFFERMINRGFRFVWCAEAPVYEAVTPERLKRSFMLRRALLRGRNPRYGFRDLLESMIAVVLYALTLPLMFFLRHDMFMKYLIKECDHIGRILALIGLHPIREHYILL